MRFKIISYNLKSLELSNLCKLSNFLVHGKYDIICLQETESSISKEVLHDILKLQYLMSQRTGTKYYCKFSQTVNRIKKGCKYGITILSRYPILNFQEFYYKHKRYEKRCCQMIEISIGKLNFKIYNTHLGWQTSYEIQQLQLQELQELLKLQQDTTYSILCGDFNIDFQNKKSFILENIKKKYQDTEMKLFTYPSKNPKYRYDYIWLSKNILQELQAKFYYQVIKNLDSDHLPITCSIYIPNEVCQ